MKKKYIVGIDLGGTNLKVALLDIGCRIRNKKIIGTQGFVKKENLISAIVSSINSIIQDNKLAKADILGIGLGLPGPVDPKAGLVYFFPNIAGWKEVRLKTVLKKKIGLPVFLDNDAKLMCLAEYRLGRAKGSRNALCITLGTGVGGAIIIDGILYRGANNAAGEIGHIPINEKGPLCNCGGIACLETYIGNKRIKEEAKKLFKPEISLEELSALARKRDKRALSIWLTMARRLGRALVAVVNLLNLDAVVIGGGVAGAGKVLFDNVREIIKTQAMTVQSKRVKIFKAKLGNDAGLIGAAIMVKEAIKEKQDENIH